MPERRPLVLDDGQLAELPAGDSLPLPDSTQQTLALLAEMAPPYRVTVDGTPRTTTDGQLRILR